MRRATAAGLAGVLTLMAGCGGSEPGITSAPATQTSGTVVLPATTTPADQRATPPSGRIPKDVPSLTAPPAPAPSPRRAYLRRLSTLAARLGPAIDAAASSGDSAAIGAIDEQVKRTTDAWRASGGAPSPAATALAMALATARSNVETPLLLGESRRQVRAARAALATELASG